MLESGSGLVLATAPTARQSDFRTHASLVHPRTCVLRGREGSTHGATRSTSPVSTTWRRRGADEVSAGALDDSETAETVGADVETYACPRRRTVAVLLLSMSSVVVVVGVVGVGVRRPTEFPRFLGLLDGRSGLGRVHRGRVDLGEHPLHENLTMRQQHQEHDQRP